ncbi:hypothetical protein F2Q68_00004577 [Brassica cretica]|uniref:Uncharacterized protein n=1 Tax=Brassica cretica TaxID=69181 RepID=A0A8S9JH58_BRACR|nr:hypothetical protein F2Q68_00004577 [Brassica cretica]
MADHLGLKVEPSKESFTFVDCSQRSPGGIVRNLEVQIGNALVPVDFHVLDIKLNWNSSPLDGRAFLSTVGAVCNMQTNQLYLTLIDPPCHCEAEYEAEYSASIETHTATSINSANQKLIDIPKEELIDIPKEESIDSSPCDWENDYYNPIMAVHNATPEIRTAMFDEEYRREGILVYKFRPLKPEVQAQAEIDSLLAEDCGKGTRFSQISEADRRAAIDREKQ